MKSWYKISNTSVWDAWDGIGSTPNNVDVEYKGYITSMYPSEFRSYVLPGVSNDKSADYLVEAVRNGKKMGQPMLYLEWHVDRNVWQVVGHEGRSRSIAFERLFGNNKMEVHVITDIRPEHYTSEMREAIIMREV